MTLPPDTLNPVYCNLMGIQNTRMQAAVKHVMLSVPNIFGVSSHCIPLIKRYEEKQLKLGMTLNVTQHTATWCKKAHPDRQNTIAQRKHFYQLQNTTTDKIPAGYKKSFKIKLTVETKN